LAFYRCKLLDNFWTTAKNNTTLVLAQQSVFSVQIHLVISHPKHLKLYSGEFSGFSNNPEKLGWKQSDKT